MTALRTLTYLGRVAIALSVACAPLAAQDKCGPNDVVPWWPRLGFGSNEHTAADKAIMDANLKAAEEVVRNTAYGTPRGFASSRAGPMGIPRARGISGVLATPLAIQFGRTST